MITTFFDMIIKMSSQGVIMIMLVLLVRFVLKKLQVNHKYLVGLWLIVFFYLIFPYKISLPIGFWGNWSVLEEMQMTNSKKEGGKEEVGLFNEEINKNNVAHRFNNNANENVLDNILDSTTNENNIDNGFDNITNETVIENNLSNTIKENSTNKDAIDTKLNTTIKDSSIQEHMENKYLNIGSVFMQQSSIAYIWLFVYIILLLNFVCSYFRMKKILQLSIPYVGKIWWAQEIDTPMVFGLFHPKIYLPISCKKEQLSYMIVHETMHIRRRDYLIKMLVYMICLLYWFHPIVWVGYYLLAEDMEKACDEAVLSNMGEEKKKAYANAMLHFISDSSIKRKGFVAPVCFNEGSIKSRIENIIKYKPTLPQMRGIVVTVSMVLLILFMTKSEAILIDTESEKMKNEVTDTNMKLEQIENEVIDTNTELEQIQNNKKNEIETGEDLQSSIFYTLDLKTLQVEEDFSLERYYITNRYTWENHFYIDESGILWGTGTNEYGQLGIHASENEGEQKEPVKIAEDVISVDASEYGYFCIFLTESGNLYGIGTNHKEILLGKGSEQPIYSSHEGCLLYSDCQKVTKPVLLMEDVAYARAGGTSIVALKKDKTAYWWGEYHKDRAQNMHTNEPIKVMENCKYITTGFYHGAAINENGELYTWGWNILGQCGTKLTEDEFVRTPVKVLEDVSMVWVDRIGFNEPYDEELANIKNQLSYRYNTFVLTNHGEMLATGMDIGNKQRIAEIATELGIAQKYRYSDIFVPIQVRLYTKNIPLPSKF